jgi:hypothetical protein
LGHVCDHYDKFKLISEENLPARVVLVQKDSRGPRLISCEPVDFQWIQQGLAKAIVELCETHPLTKENVFFTDQLPNRMGALIGSSTGKYSTLDLNEASDRVSVELVRLLYPENIVRYLMACRSSSTVLPDGEVLKLNKFAPMGSALCFPILALTVWAILTASAPDTDMRGPDCLGRNTPAGLAEHIYVYGDDVIVPTAGAANAIEQLESFGLKINRDKSCTSGLFRESCGMDAFKGVDVTPVRLRTVWSSDPSPDVYTSYIAYANEFRRRRYYGLSNYIAEELTRIYGQIPTQDMNLSCPSLTYAPETSRKLRQRWNSSLQKREYKVWDVKSPVVKQSLPGWSLLLRYFAEKANDANRRRPTSPVGSCSFEPDQPFSVSEYTHRRASMLVRRWR